MKIEMNRTEKIIGGFFVGVMLYCLFGILNKI